MRSVVQSKTKNFVALAALSLVSRADLLSALPANSFTSVGSFYMVNTEANFKDFLDDVFDAAAAAGGPRARVGAVLLDMGVELQFGVVGKESQLLTVRLVKAAAVSAGDADEVGFVVTDNKVAGGKFTVVKNPQCQVARV